MCKTVSFVLDVNGGMYYFTLADRKKLLKANPNYYSYDSHTSITSYFGLNDDRVDKYEVNIKTMKVIIDNSGTKNTEQNQKILQSFVDKQKKKFWKDLIYYSPNVDLSDNIPDWLLDNGKLYLPNATWVDCNNNQLTSLDLPNAERVDCRNNQLTSINVSESCTVYK